MRKKFLVSAMLSMLLACAGSQGPGKVTTSSGTDITLGGGNGDSYETAVIIKGARKQSEGLEAEYSYLSRLHGEKDKTWRIHGQSIFREEKRVYDVIEIELIPSNEKRIYYFDVTKLPWDKK